MAGGWSRDGAVQDHIDTSVGDAVERARQQLPSGEGLSQCEECDVTIPDARQQAIPGIRLCVACQDSLDASNKNASGLNRRGSEDSQLR